MNIQDDNSFVVIDDGDLRKYRIELPNLIDDIGLSVYAFRLYVHYKRVAGANQGGTCRQGTRTLAKACNMGIATISRSKEELIKAGLIEIEKGDPVTNGSDIVTIVDIWERNFRAFKGKKPPPRGADPVPVGNTPPVPVGNTPVPTGNTPVPVGNIRSNLLEKEPIEKEQGEGEAASPPAPPPPVHVVNTSTKAVAHPNTKPILDAYIAACAYEKPFTKSQYQRESPYAKELAEAGYTPQEVVAAYDKLKSDEFWAKQHLGLRSLVTQMPAMIQQARNGNSQGRYNVNGRGTNLQDHLAGNGQAQVSKREQDEWLAKQPKPPF